MANNRNVLNCTPLLFSLSVILVFGCLGMTEARSYRLQQNTEGQQEASYGTNSLLQSRQSFPERRQSAAGPALAVGALVFLAGISTVAGIGIDAGMREQRDNDAKATAKAARVSRLQAVLAAATAAVTPAQARLNTEKAALRTSQTTLATAQTALDNAQANLVAEGAKMSPTVPELKVVINAHTRAREAFNNAQMDVNMRTARRDAEQVKVDKLNDEVTDAQMALATAQAS